MQRYLIKIFKIILLLALSSAILVLSLRWINPFSSAFILTYQVSNLSKVKHEWVDIEDISPWLQISTIASEDQKFPQHFGFDIQSIKYALAEKNENRKGASTISQQVAKNLFLWSGRSYIRKAIEAWFTLLMEAMLPKKRILEIYLNIAEFGPGVYGAEAASKQFFSRSARRISLKQAALLSAVLPNPKSRSVTQPSAYVRSRAKKIQRMVRQLGGVRYLQSL